MLYLHIGRAALGEFETKHGNVAGTVGASRRAPINYRYETTTGQVLVVLSSQKETDGQSASGRSSTRGAR